MSAIAQPDVKFEDAELVSDFKADRMAAHEELDDRYSGVCQEILRRRVIRTGA